MKFFIKPGTAGNTPEELVDDTPEVPETPNTPPTENAPLHRGEVKETITETHQYIYAGGKLLRETISDGTTTKTLDFNYDNVGMPYSLIYNNGTTTTTYYYITNLQGDVMYLVDANGVQVAAYDYDPYGKIITATGTMAEINPLRYRGYYYDSDTGFYYLQSRYYDPEICRFINADSYASTGQSFLGYNAFAYCGNNPVINADAEGNFWHIVIGAAVGAAISAVSSIVSTVVEDGWGSLKDGKTWAKVGVATLAGGASGALAATGVGLCAAITLNAGISMAENAATQAIEGKDFDVCDMLFDGVVGAISGAIGGPGNGNKHLSKLGKQTITRVKAGLKKGLKEGLKEAGKAFAYYSKNTIKYYKNFARAIPNNFASSLCSTFVISQTMKKQYRRLLEA